MKKIFIKFLTTILVVMILFQFIVIEKSNIVLATEDGTWEGYDESAVEQEKEAIEDNRSLFFKIFDGMVSIILTLFKLPLVAPRLDFKWNYNSIGNYGRK